MRTLLTIHIHKPAASWPMVNQLYGNAGWFDLATMFRWVCTPPPSLYAYGQPVGTIERFHVAVVQVAVQQ